MHSAPTKRPSDNTPISSELPKPTESAKAAGLRYVYDTRPGITRKRVRNGFRYVKPDGHPLRDAEELRRIKSLAVPPAWTAVWICPIPHGHLQATGRDARGRKQSRYHPLWRSIRDEAKYEHMLHFGNALPCIRQRVEHDLSLPGLPREKVLATIVRLLETTFIRVGNPEYARENKSYGLTTMKRRHVEINGSKLTFTFKGKSGVQHKINLTDRRLARIVKSCRDTPGYELFEYIDSEGNPHTIDSTDVNDYLFEITQQHFTAKDFRTWAGTVLASVTLCEFEACDSATQIKKNIVQAIATVAQRLGNTPSVCRKCYVHPAVLESYLNGTMKDLLKDLLDKRPATQSSDATATSLRTDELALIHLLQEHTKLPAD